MVTRAEVLAGAEIERHQLLMQEARTHQRNIEAEMARYRAAVGHIEFVYLERLGLKLEPSDSCVLCASGTGAFCACLKRCGSDRCQSTAPVDSGETAARELAERMGQALSLINEHGHADGDHHKAYVIAQVYEALTSHVFPGPAGDAP